MSEPSIEPSSIKSGDWYDSMNQFWGIPIKTLVVRDFIGAKVNNYLHRLVRAPYREGFITNERIFEAQQRATFDLGFRAIDFSRRKGILKSMDEAVLPQDIYYASSVFSYILLNFNLDNSAALRHIKGIDMTAISFNEEGNPVLGDKIRLSSHQVRRYFVIAALAVKEYIDKVLAKRDQKSETKE